MRQTLTISDEAYLSIRSLSVTYAAGWTSAEHSHPWPQLLYCQRGAIRAQINGTVWVIAPRRGLWIPAGMLHRIHALGELELRTLYCQPDAMPPGLGAVHAIAVGGLLHEAILRTCELHALDRRIPAQASLAFLVHNEISDARTDAVALPMPSERRAAKLAQAMLNEIAPDLASLLTANGLSRRTAERLFLRETGISPARWYRMVRLARALEQLLTGSSVDAAMDAAGFHSRSAFASAFISTFGCAPSEILRSLQKAQ